MCPSPLRRPLSAQPGAPGRRHGALVYAAAIAALLLACEDRSSPSPTTAPTTSATASPTRPAPPVSTSTGPAHPRAETAATSTTPQGPSDCPAWVRAARCVAGEDVVAVASVRGIRDANLARTTAENRALARALADDGRSERAGPHTVLEVTSCDGATWARVAVPRARVGHANSLPRCR